MERTDRYSDRQVGSSTNDQLREVRQADLATAVAARIFGDTSIRLPFALAASVEMQANMAKQLPGAENFIYIAPNDRAFLQRQQRERDEDDTRSLAQLVDEIERQREREEWARTASSFGSVQMTGAEWHAFAEDLRQDGPLRRWLLDRVRRDGKTEEEARSAADRVADVADIMAIPPAQRTVAQRQQLETARRDPALTGYLEEAARQRQNMNGPRSDRDRASALGSVRSSVSAGADELASFSTAPPLRDHHARAQLPSTGAQPAPSPAQSSAPPPSPAASGFDI